MLLGVRANWFSMFFFGIDYTQADMVLFLFINMLTLVLGFVRTEQELDAVRKRQQEIVDTNQMLQRLNRAKSNFLGNISHEMKTPLAVMSNCAGLTLRQYHKNAFDEESEQNLATIQREAVRLGRMVEQLMGVAMEEERQRTLAETTTGELLHRAATFCELLCKENGNHIALAGGEPLKLRADIDGIFQVLVNLISNASRHTAAGTITIGATPAGTEQEALVHFYVRDTGEGMDPALLPRIFERGVSGGERSGLGLAISKEIVDEHGGKMDIQSTKDGTQVVFTIPRWGELG